MFLYWRHVKSAFRICPELQNPGDRILFAVYARSHLEKLLPFRQRILLWLTSKFKTGEYND